MKDPFVITISRTVGSGGRTIGRKLAERLGVRFSDKELRNLRERRNAGLMISSRWLLRYL